MNKKLKAKALLKHRLILQAAMCVEDLLLATEKDGGRPWIAIVYDHMESLFRDKEKEKYKRSKLKAKCDHKFVDSKNCLKCGWIPE